MITIGGLECNVTEFLLNFGLEIDSSGSKKRTVSAQITCDVLNFPDIVNEDFVGIVVMEV